MDSQVGDQQLVEFCTLSCGAAAERIRSSYEASVSGRRTAVTDERLLLRALVILFQAGCCPLLIDQHSPQLSNDFLLCLYCLSAILSPELVPDIVEA